jgi:hypothetical protein
MESWEAATALANKINADLCRFPDSQKLQHY